MSEKGPDWSPCRAIVRHDGGDPEIDDEGAEIEIREGRILLVYFDERGAVIYEGREEEPGRFAMLARSRPRKARLVQRGLVLEGTWSEQDETGSMRIELRAEGIE